MAIVVNIICLKMVEKLKDGLFKHTLLEQKKKKRMTVNILENLNNKTIYI
jgi:hypothetical protein